MEVRHVHDMRSGERGGSAIRVASTARNDGLRIIRGPGSDGKHALKSSGAGFARRIWKGTPMKFNLSSDIFEIAELEREN